ncbi:RH35 [Symbiodinium natans]|uniref:RH35 protein n=1 Tax=Symbiodinium natans TaxID=878477 RepID=A0A812I9U0_9DINO|nr:RH35 [Symbiodinium natans]
MAQIQVPVVQRGLERQNLERAQRRRRVIEEEGQKARRSAVAFRQRRETVESPDDKEAAQPADAREADRNQRLQQVLGKLSASIQLPTVEADTKDKEGSEYGGLMSSDSEEADPVELEQRKLSERSKQIRKRVKEAAINGIREKKKFVDRMNRKRRYREALWKALPQAERVATESAFKLHCNQYQMLTAEAALDALRDMGLRGRTMVERSVVERAVGSLVKELICVEEQGIQGAWGSAPKGSPQVWWRTPRELSALPMARMAQAKTKTVQPTPPVRARQHNRRASATGIRQSSVSAAQRSSTLKDEQAAKELVAAMEQKTPRPTGIPVEAFGAEVVPVARWELFEQRTEPHFRLFVKEIEASPNPSGINYDQFQKLVASLELDKAKGPLPPAIKREKQKVGPETILDLEMVHIRLLQLEERAARAASAREWAVARQAKVIDSRFKKHRPELLWMWEMFSAHDDDHSGFLGQYEIRRLLKYMGLEPYKRSVAHMVDHIISQVDENHDDEIDFNEFLLLVDQLRSFMMKRRRLHLQRFYLGLELDQSGCLDFDQIVAALAQEGLLRSRNEYALAQELLDEEFDLRAVLQPSSEADSPLSLSSPRSSSLSPRKMRQRQALMAEDAGMVDFYGFCLIYELVWERLSQLQGERICQAAKALNFTMTELSDIQAAFDMADGNGDNKLTRGELREVLIPLIARMPDEQQLKHVLASIDTERTDGIDILEFLKILRSLVTGPNGMVHMYKPFSLIENVTYEKQQELLGVWPISDSYIKNLDANELMEMLSNFLGVRPEQNLRELPYPISSYRKLKEFALRQAEKATQRHRF